MLYFDFYSLYVIFLPSFPLIKTSIQSTSLRPCIGNTVKKSFYADCTIIAARHLSSWKSIWQPYKTPLIRKSWFMMHPKWTYELCQFYSTAPRPNGTPGRREEMPPRPQCSAEIPLSHQPSLSSWLMVSIPVNVIFIYGLGTGFPLNWMSLLQCAALFCREESKLGFWWIDAYERNGFPMQC